MPWSFNSMGSLSFHLQGFCQDCFFNRNYHLTSISIFWMFNTSPSLSKRKIINYKRNMVLSSILFAFLKTRKGWGGIRTYIIARLGMAYDNMTVEFCLKCRDILVKIMLVKVVLQRVQNLWVCLFFEDNNADSWPNGKNKWYKIQKKNKGIMMLLLSFDLNFLDNAHLFSIYILLHLLHHWQVW